MRSNLEIFDEDISEEEEAGDYIAKRGGGGGGKKYYFRSCELKARGVWFSLLTT